MLDYIINQSCDEKRVVDVVHVGQSSKAKTDIPILLNKNQLKALRQMVFGVVKKALGISPLPDGAPHGYQVNLSAAVAWAAREA
ncbi:unnamed protein product [Porites lobata]|uniref:Uncharacterized protein n=1 Tax=Porites lobata TaxID=104759 RepID=A0ABN8N3K6_9CNID|nr:unnamed protein product [Porites lobata]